MATRSKVSLDGVVGGLLWRAGVEGIGGRLNRFQKGEIRGQGGGWKGRWNLQGGHGLGGQARSVGGIRREGRVHKRDRRDKQSPHEGSGGSRVAGRVHGRYWGWQTVSTEGLLGSGRVWWGHRISWGLWWGALRDEGFSLSPPGPGVIFSLLTPSTPRQTAPFQ